MPTHRLILAFATGIALSTGGCTTDADSIDSADAADSAAEALTVTPAPRGSLLPKDLPLTTTMHNNLFKRTSGVNDIAANGEIDRDVLADVAYLQSTVPNRAHGFVTFHARAGAKFTLSASSVQSQKDLPSGIDPVIAIYHLANNLSTKGQLPLAVAESTVAPFSSANLEFVANQGGLYVVAVYHRIPELVLPLETRVFHGFHLEVSGDSGLGFEYPTANVITINGRSGEACEPTKAGFPLTRCRVRPRNCYLAGFKKVGIDDVLVRPGGCDDPKTLPANCRYPAAQGVGVDCARQSPAKMRCLFDEVANEVVCE